MQSARKFATICVVTGAGGDSYLKVHRTCAMQSEFVSQEERLVYRTLYINEPHKVKSSQVPFFSPAHTSTDVSLSEQRQQAQHGRPAAHLPPIHRGRHALPSLASTTPEAATHPDHPDRPDRPPPAPPPRPRRRIFKAIYHRKITTNNLEMI